MAKQNPNEFEAQVKKNQQNLRTGVHNMAIALLLCLALLTQACGGGFAQNLRAVLALSTPLIDSLVTAGIIKPELRTTYIQDFQDLADGAATLKEGLDACSKGDKVCGLDAVDRLQQRFWEVQRRGHFGTHPKLQNIERILQGIILAARVYYGAIAPRGEVILPIDEQIKELKEAMKPETKVAAADCNAPRYSFIAACDEPPRHPCQTAHGHELGIIHSVNCDFDNRHKP